MRRADDTINELLTTHGKLLAVVCKNNPKSIKMIFERDIVVGNCEEGYFMQFGSLTGATNFWRFLHKAGITLSYKKVLELKAPATLLPKKRRTWSSRLIKQILLADNS